MWGKRQARSLLYNTINNTKLNQNGIKKIIPFIIYSRLWTGIGINALSIYQSGFQWVVLYGTLSYPAECQPDTSKWLFVESNPPNNFVPLIFLHVYSYFFIYIDFSLPVKSRGQTYDLNITLDDKCNVSEKNNNEEHDAIKL